MATVVQVSVDEYLRTTYEHDAEYVEGEIVERGMPTRPHSRRQSRAAAFFEKLADAGHAVFSCTELTMKLDDDRYRVPDLAGYFGQEPPEQHPSIPPAIVLEILSPDDRIAPTIDKLAEYARWGVPHVWLVDPEDERMFVYRGGALHPADSLAIPELATKLRRADIF